MSNPVTVDISVAASSKQDLDDYMVSKGWQYVGTVDYP